MSMDTPESIRSLFANLPEIDFLGLNREDWDDTMLCGKHEGIRVYTMLDKDVVELGSKVLGEIMQFVTQENMGAIILLAWNLRNPSNLTSPIFPNHSPCASSEDVDFHTLSKVKIAVSKGHVGTLRFPISAAEAAASITYVCASLLRLFTKPANNYLNTLPQIKSNFSNFYHFEFPLTWFNPPKSSLETISMRFQNNSIFKYGMAGMLYLHNEIEIARGLRTTLYEQHLSCTGMHAYPLFVRVQSALEIPAEELLELLNHRMINREVKTLGDIVRKYDGGNVAENEKRMTWKYARIFDSSFFKSIQTKNCTYLVCILANLSNMAGVQGESIWGIVQLQGLGDFMKDFCRNFAQRVYDAVMTSKCSKNSTLDSDEGR